MQPYEDLPLIFEWHVNRRFIEDSSFMVWPVEIVDVV